MNLRSTPSRYVAGVALTALVAGCSGGPTSSLSPLEDPLASLIAQAEVEGAPSSQVAVLQAALAEGRQVNFEEYHAAVEAKFDCIAGLGYEVVYVQEVERPGWTEVTFAIGGGKEGADLLDPAVDDCRQRTSAWIEFAYQLNYDHARAEQMINALSA